MSQILTSCTVIAPLPLTTTTLVGEEMSSGTYIVYRTFQSKTSPFLELEMLYRGNDQDRGASIFYNAAQMIINLPGAIVSYWEDPSIRSAPYMT